VVFTDPDLAVRRAKLKVSSVNRPNGKAKLKMIIDDTNASTFEDDLLSGNTTMDISDGQFFDVPGIQLSSCARRGSRILRCLSTQVMDGASVAVRATFRRSRDDVDVYDSTVILRRLPSSLTQTVQPSPPVQVVLHQNVSRDRIGTTEACKSTGRSSLTCNQR
jgi:hypothetical protein